MPSWLGRTVKASDDSTFKNKYPVPWNVIGTHIPKGYRKQQIVLFLQL
jgi:hypothetical protein